MLACPEHVSDKSRMGGGFRALRGPTPHEQNASLKCGVLAKHRYHLSKSPCETNPAMPHHAVPFVCVCVRVRGCLYLQLFVFACGISRTYICHIVCVYIYIFMHTYLHTCIRTQIVQWQILTQVMEVKSTSKLLLYGLLSYVGKSLAGWAHAPPRLKRRRPLRVFGAARNLTRHWQRRR